MSDAAARRARILVPASLGAVYLIWSSTYYALGIVVRALPPLLSAGIRYAIAGALLYGIARLSGVRAPTRAEWRAATLIGALLCVCGNGFVALAERQVSSGLAAVTCAAMPIVACLIEVLFGLRPRLREWVGVLLGFSGVIALGVGDLGAKPAATILLCGASVGWALGSVLSRRWPRAPGVMAAATQLFCGGLANTVLALALGERIPPVLPTKAVLALLYLVVFGSIVAFSAYNYLLVHTSTAVATSYAYLTPVLALAIGATLGGEHVSKNAIFSTVLVIAGVAIVVTAPKRSATVPVDRDAAR